MRKRPSACPRSASRHSGTFLQHDPGRAAWSLPAVMRGFTMPPLVSIIIPCRNGAEWLTEAIESCLTQSWTAREIIVVDNGSSDRSLAVARHYEPAVVTLQCHQPGASAARNVGLRRARGEFIQFLDADDVLDRDKIGAQVQRLATARPGAVATG